MISIINKSSLPDADIALSARAIAKQIRYHVAPAYGQSVVPVIFFAHESMSPPGAWPIYVLDTPDQAGALGYHDLDPQGNPYGRVFVAPSQQAGVSISSVLSHEVIEAFCDPDINRWATNINTGQYYAWEACDAVENDSYMITIAGPASQGGTHHVEVSNFVLPAFYDVTDHGPYDYLGKLTAPFTMTKGGYMIVAAPSKEKQVFGDRFEWRATIKDAPGSRTGRRISPVSPDSPVQD